MGESLLFCCCCFESNISLCGSVLLGFLGWGGCFSPPLWNGLYKLLLIRLLDHQKVIVFLQAMVEKCVNLDNFCPFPQAGNSHHFNVLCFLECSGIAHI